MCARYQVDYQAYLKTCDDDDEYPLDDLMELGGNLVHIPYNCGEFRDEHFRENNVYVGLAFDKALSVEKLLEAVSQVKNSTQIRYVMNATQQTWDNNEDIRIWACPSYD